MTSVAKVGDFAGQTRDMAGLGVEELDSRVEMAHVGVGQVDERLDLGVDGPDDVRESRSWTMTAPLPAGARRRPPRPERPLQPVGVAHHPLLTSIRLLATGSLSRRHDHWTRDPFSAWSDVTPGTNRRGAYTLQSMIARSDDGSAGDADYGEIGTSYLRYRKPDSRIADRIFEALGSARTVINVGTGLGSYEPMDRIVTPVEPSASHAGSTSGAACTCGGRQSGGSAIPRRLF
jgi:hypothetical protein